MNNFIKKSLSLVVCACMLSVGSEVAVGAENEFRSNRESAFSEQFKDSTVLSEQNDLANVDFSESIEGSYINPLYSSVIDESYLPQTPHVRTSFAMSEYSDFNASMQYLRREMKARKNKIEVKLKYKFSDTVSPDGVKKLAQNLINSALEHTGIPDEGDYIAYQYGACSYSITGFIVDGEYYLDIEYAFKYYTTEAQEKQVDTAVNDLIDSLDIDDESDYEKFEEIYDWMCDNIIYDNDNLDDTDYLLKHTAYAAIIDRKAVCQGYATLLYRLALEAGIDARYISGLGNGEPHGWNIVKIGSKYYNVDATWDAVYKQADFDYLCFLKAENTFIDHIRSDEFLSDDFTSLYPMADRDFAPDHKHVYGDWIVVKEPTEESEGLRRCECLICGEIEEEVLDRLNHVHEYTDERVSPTCTERGYTEHTCVCGYSITDSYVDPLRHNYHDEVTKATCTAKGFTTHTCDRCGDSYTDKETPALGHIYGEYYTVDIHPTRDVNGVRYRICEICGEREEQTIPKLQNSSVVFNDLTADWYRQSVDYVLTKGLMDGKGGGMFAPDENMTRAQFATVLWRIAGSPASSTAVPFTDLDRNAEWYLTAVAWAYEYGIINGTSSTTFEPEGNIKRQDMAVILHRYAEKYMDYDVSGNADLSVFPDSGNIDGYAVQAISWANYLKIITGKDGQIVPIAPGTRAEVATILMRFDLLH